MGALQKVGFVVGLLVAVLLMVPLIQSVDPTAKQAAKSTEAELPSSGESGLNTVASTVEKSKDVAPVDTPVESDVSMPANTEQQGVAEQHSPSGAADAEDLLERKPTESSELPVVSTTIGDSAEPTNEEGAAAADGELKSDRFFGPFDSAGRAKRFAVTFAEKTGFDIEVEKADAGGWYVVVGYVTGEQRQRQRQALELATGLQLLP